MDSRIGVVVVDLGCFFSDVVSRPGDTFSFSDLDSIVLEVFGRLARSDEYRQTSTSSIVSLDLSLSSNFSNPIISESSLFVSGEQTTTKREKKGRKARTGRRRHIAQQRADS
mgnify:CR=1 FL=1